MIQNIWKKQLPRQLMDYMSALKSKAETQAFLDDLCSPQEIEDFAKRLECAIMIMKGKNYRDIAKKLDLSTTTVTRVAKWAKNKNGGFQTLYKKTQK